MSLPDPILDDLRFQKDLVDEARQRIVDYCPGWTDYNLSDPGITLIELFAWMTEMITYRLNRVPEKTYVKFLEMLGVVLAPSSSASTELTYWLAAPLPLSENDSTIVTIPKGTEVATRFSETEPEIIFTTNEGLEIIPPRVVQLRREEDTTRNYAPRMGIETFYAFNRNNPQEGDTFFIGFDPHDDLRGHTLRLSFDCEKTQAVGIRREDPPLVWECSTGDGSWKEIPPSSRPGEDDTTGGLNNEEGSLVLYLPLTWALDAIHGREAYWIRCRFEQRRPEQGRYTESPRIISLSARTIGATTSATHAVNVVRELLGNSSGEPGQHFNLEHVHILPLEPDETLEIQETGYGDIGYIPWRKTIDFSNSSPTDRQYTIDLTNGIIHLGPAVRQPDNSLRQYGRVPPPGRGIRFSKYRHGGGTIGNLPGERLQMLKTSIPYVDRVLNLVRAEGGRDAETLDEAKMRARREMRSQERAVTAQDFELLVPRSSREIYRVRCVTPGEGPSAPPPGTVQLLVVPAALKAVRQGDLSKLAVTPLLTRQIINYLDNYRMIGTSVRVSEPNYIGIQIGAEIVVSPFSDPDEVKARIIEQLNAFLTPLPILNETTTPTPFLGENWQGWPFGRDLLAVEIDTLIRQINGVMHVWEITLSHRKVIPDQEEAIREEGDSHPGAALTVIEDRRLEVPADTLLCSLQHHITVVEEEASP
jgi:predicted phage baseplate assembly protein